MQQENFGNLLLLYFFFFYFLFFSNIGKDLLDIMVKRYLIEKFDSVEKDILDVKDSAEEDYIMIDDGQSMLVLEKITNHF